ncbi:hypothetical protein [Micromonospora sp. NPDC005189]|uniref:hypothetical protein n=1 Tax=unclassified Micromonospora TaxID=2617518 RepID=UPI0033AB5F4B
MIVQWCIKGMHLGSDREAQRILRDPGGLVSNWWRDVGTIRPDDIREKLTEVNLDMHVNHFDDPDPVSGRKFSEVTPFISLAAGVVERDKVARTNFVHTAQRTALWFGTGFGRRPTAYLFTCWVMLGTRSAVEIEHIAEEIRDLNTYRRYSDFQTEGEVTAKISVPGNQIKECKKWEWDQTAKKFSVTGRWMNPQFVPPDALSNIREVVP